MTPTAEVATLAELAERVARLAEARGADAAEVRATSGRDLSARVRGGSVEALETSRHRSVALRLFREGRVALGATSDLSQRGLEGLVDDALALADLAEADPRARPLEQPSAPGTVDASTLDLHDASVDALEVGDLVEAARDLERAVRMDGVRAEDATASASRAASALVLSSGFAAGYTGTVSSLEVAALAERAGERRQRARVASLARHREDLPLPEALGRRAATRAAGKLGTRPLASCEAPVVFHPEIAAELLELFVTTLLGTAIRPSDTAQGARVASGAVTIVDDPLVPRGLGSRPFDGEGAPSEAHRLVAAGLLETVLCDRATARALGRRPTASARRTPSGGLEVSASNVTLLASTVRAEDLLRSTARGLYVTETLGLGFDPHTRRLSRAVSGYWIDGGELAFPVNEVVLSLDLHELFRRVDAVGDDPQRTQTVTAPTLRVAQVPLIGSG
jgi:PmbA protein